MEGRRNHPHLSRPRFKGRPHLATVHQGQIFYPSLIQGGRTTEPSRTGSDDEDIKGTCLGIVEKISRHKRKPFAITVNANILQ